MKSDHLKIRNNFKSGLLKVGFQMIWFSNGLALAMAQPFENQTIKIWTFLSAFQIVLDKKAAICPDFNNKDAS